MGQQQLLLLILGIIIVSAAVVYGIQAFDENRLKSQEDNKMLKMYELAGQAQSWKSMPSLMGGDRESGPSDFSQFTVQALGLTPTGGPATTPYVHLPGAGCFRFFTASTHLRINALNEDCVLGSWTIGIIISGINEDDITWEYRGGQ